MGVRSKAVREKVLRGKVRAVARTLESLYGTPRLDAATPILDSLIGCILSQNTNDANSSRAWESLRERFPTWADAAAATTHNIERAIRVGGLAPSKSKRIKAILRDVYQERGEYSLEFLRDTDDEDVFEYLKQSKGVGVKTAAVVMLFAMGRDVFPVDTHIHRIAQRLGFVPEGTSRDGVFEAMRTLVPKGKSFPFHVNLIRFGRERCRKRNPLCKGCPLARQCLYVRGEVTL